MIVLAREVKVVPRLGAVYRDLVKLFDDANDDRYALVDPIRPFMAPGFVLETYSRDDAAAKLKAWPKVSGPGQYSVVVKGARI